MKQSWDWGRSSPRRIQRSTGTIPGSSKEPKPGDILVTSDDISEIGSLIHDRWIREPEEITTLLPIFIISIDDQWFLCIFRNGTIGRAIISFKWWR